MIFVTLGTNDKSFERLLQAVEKACQEGIIKDDHIVVQSGYTKYSSTYFDIHPSLNQEEFQQAIEDADFVITHGGVGTIMTALHKKKVILAAARLEEYGEHVNDHQIQLLEAFEKDGYLIYMRDLNSLDVYFKKAKTFKPKGYQSNTSNFVSFLKHWIETSVQ